MNPLLSIRDLALRIGGQPILRGVHLDVHAGQVAGLVGESGAGKSMVGRVVLRLQPEDAHVDRGEVAFDGRDLLWMSEREHATFLGRDIALIPQNPMTALNPVARIAPQMTDVLRMHMGMDRDDALARALESLHDVQIRDPERVLRQFPHELSGGMRQRVLIAIAFACRPKLIIADEPTTALDVTVQKQVLRLLKRLQRAYGTAILFITHDLGVVAKLCDTMSVIHAGRIVEAGPVAQVFLAPAHAYTRALLAATPRYDRPGEALQPIPAALTEQLWNEARTLDTGAA
ncbi:MAG: ABC transporter ATP-binding protein [Burkholderiales bacterium]|nr:ABC transporter ATP-binding protein [Burkholderiales bacterium]